MTNNELFEQFCKEWPPVFPADQLDRLTGGALRWTTIQNLRSIKDKNKLKRKDGSEKSIPPEACFRRDGCRKILIIRDELLRWWFSTLS